MRKNRKVEAFIGEHASGKSENAINRALALRGQGRKVTLVDLDLVDPFFTLRPLKEKLEKRGISLVGITDSFGLGEAGTPFTREMQNVLRLSGDIIFDIGYGVFGAKALNLIEGAMDDPNLRIFCVINIARPMTSTLDRIIKHVSEQGKIHGLINNSHLGKETTVEIVQEGALLVSEAARILKIPVIATSIFKELAGKIGERDAAGNDVWLLERFMHDAYW